MFPSLDDELRRRLLHVSAALCAVPVLLSPLTARPAPGIESRLLAATNAFALPHFTAVRGPVAEAGRDPFIGDGNVARRVIAGQPMLLPPNVAAQHMPLWSTPEPAQIQAIVSGPGAPRALILDGGKTRIVSAGDAIGGARIVEIDAAGLRLANGSSLRLGGGSE